MLIKRGDARVHQNSSNCTVREHDHPIPNLSYAEAKITGRYPEKGRSLNVQCDTIFIGLSGVGIIHTEIGDYTIEPHDTCFVERCLAYWIEGSDLELGVSNFPRWNPEQYRVID
jgi:hypothetical protein